MPNSIIPILLVPAIAVVLGGCSPDAECPDCDDEIAAEAPCDGADLDADDRNCGRCGHECAVMYPGTAYEVGHCAAGRCGPYWYTRSFEPVDLNGPPPPPVTCAEICADADAACVARGCSEKTGFTCGFVFESGCDLHDPDFAALDFGGTCDEPVPWPSFDPGRTPKIGCCCE